MGNWALKGYSKDIPRHLSHSGTSRALRHSDTQGTGPLRHLATRALGHAGTCALGHSKVTWVVGHSGNRLLKALYLADSLSIYNLFM